MRVMCDDETTIYVDGKVKGRQLIWNEEATLQIPSSTSVVGIKCHNKGGRYGILVQITDLKKNSIVAVSDGSWKCSNEGKRGWSSGSFKEDTSWKQASNKAHQSPWSSYYIYSRYRAQVIWTANGFPDFTVYCRKVLQGDYNIYQYLEIAFNSHKHETSGDSYLVVGTN